MLSHGGSRGTHCRDRNGNCGNSPFVNSSFVEKITNNCISHLSITKGRPQSNQLKKIIETLPGLCQDKYYGYIPDIISTNTKPTQEYFLSKHPIKRRGSSKYHVKLGFVNPIIGLDVPSGNSPIDSEIVKNTPISTQISKNNTISITIRNQTQNLTNGINLLSTRRL